MRVSDDQVSNIAKYASVHGIEKAALNFSIKGESVTRYLREAKIRGLVDGESITFERRPNVLLLDIETAPLAAGVWGLWKQNVYIDQVYSEWFMLTWSAKWLFDDEVFADKLTPEEALAEDDKRISQSIWEFMDYADIIIAHNGDGFDLPRLNTRFLLNGIVPPSPYQSIDTLKVAKKNFDFSSNKLDFIARQLGVEGKMDAGGFTTWRDIVKFGDKDALALMEEYNKKDVFVLEEVYVKLRPWIKSHANMSLYFDDVKERCPNCGNEHLTWPEGKYYVTSMNKYSVVRCDECGAVGRSRTSALTTMQRAHLISTTAR
jgi:RNase P subunit RPR2